jgi:hypothetical protein
VNSLCFVGRTVSVKTTPIAGLHEERGQHFHHGFEAEESDLHLKGSLCSVEDGLGRQEQKQGPGKSLLRESRERRQ